MNLLVGAELGGNNIANFKIVAAIPWVGKSSGWLRVVRGPVLDNKNRRIMLISS